MKKKSVLLISVPLLLSLVVSTVLMWKVFYYNNFVRKDEVICHLESPSFSNCSEEDVYFDYLNRTWFGTNTVIKNLQRNFNYWCIAPLYYVTADIVQYTWYYDTNISTLFIITIVIWILAITSLSNFVCLELKKKK